MKSHWFLCLAGFFLCACAADSITDAGNEMGEGASRAAETVDLSPERWDEGDFDECMRLNDEFGKSKPLASGFEGMVAGTTDVPAVRAGLEALEQGGSAVDAALTTSLTQVALMGGSTISYAGIMAMVCYDASTGEIHALDAGYNTVRGEKDPLSIPSASFMQVGADQEREATPGPRGRTVLVPGFMAGVEAAHKRYGRLPFETLFEPAIYFAKKGFRINSKLARYIEYRREFLSRLPETKSVFSNEEGEFLYAGDLFKQPALAETLMRVAENGAGYMYSGPWAERFVSAVRREGGKITMEDMESYRAGWREPLRVEYRGYGIHVYPGASAFAGMLNLLEASGMSSWEHYTENPESFFWLSRIMRAVMMNPNYTGEESGSGGSGWLSKKTAEKAWLEMQRGGFPGLPAVTEKPPGHSAAVVAVDKEGNIAAVLHSINTVLWGENGIFVDGVSIPDSATFQQQLIAATGPGRRLENQTAPLIVVKDGKAVMGVSCIGSGIHPETLKVIINALDFGMDAKQAVDAASLLLPAYGPEGYSDGEQVVEGSFSSELIDGVRKMGLQVDEIPFNQAGRGLGYAVCVTIDPQSGRIGGAAPRFSNGSALGL